MAVEGGDKEVKRLRKVWKKLKKSGDASKDEVKRARRAYKDAKKMAASVERSHSPPSPLGGDKAESPVAANAASELPVPPEPVQKKKGRGRMSKAERKALKKASGRGRKRKAPANADAIRLAKESARAAATEASKKQKRVAAKPKPISRKAQMIVNSLKSGKSRGTISDRLNPAHRNFDSELKSKWASFTNRERSAISVADLEAIEKREAAVAAISYPFNPDPDDHCESPVQAYEHLAPILQQIADSIGKKPSDLRIYDPYYCAGACVRHLGSLGFTNVYNRCEDFYARIAAGDVPDHDVVVTNPPYSADHVPRLLKWARENGKPFFLLMPNHFLQKDYYNAANMLYLYPAKRYAYWTPKGLRGIDRVQRQHAGSGGYRTSPFISFWYVYPQPALTTGEVMKSWHTSRRELKNQGQDISVCTLCKLEKIPPHVMPLENY